MESVEKEVVNPLDTPVKIRSGDTVYVDSTFRVVDPIFYKWSMGIIDHKDPEIVNLFGGRELTPEQISVAYRSFQEFKKTLDVKAKGVLLDGKDESEFLRRGADIDLSSGDQLPPNFKSECRTAVMAGIVACYLLTGNLEDIAKGIIISADMSDPALMDRRVVSRGDKL